MPDAILADPLDDDVHGAGFQIPTISDASDRPELEFVVVTQPDRERAGDRTAVPQHTLES